MSASSTILESIRMDCVISESCYVISESCYKGTILQKNYRKMTISWSVSFNFFVKFYGLKNLGATT